MSLSRYVVTALAAVVLLAAVPPSAAQSRPSPFPAPPLRNDSIALVAQMRTDSVVALHVSSTDPDAEELPGPGHQGLGSGVVIDAEGLILTNAHVVDDAKVIHVVMPDGDRVTATLLGADPDVDLALVRVADARGLRPAPLGDSDRVRVGDWVIAIGNPFGLHHTVTAGIVSAKGRALDDSGVEYLQTDTALSPGSSGGPLLDLSGNVVGINVGVLPGGMNVGLNVAIPVSVVKEVLPHLRAGTVVHGWIGVATAPLSPHGATTRKLPGGLIVLGIREHGPAARAGLLPGDIIIGFPDDPTVTLQSFYRHIRSKATGTVVRLAVWRDGERSVVPVEIGRRTNPDEVQPSSER
ncbi:MAG: trypsin-like peptidase domain-containing protein [Acidobacteria bacterium]|nr:trypsin-like peptidase domain-containing protein [Acidobacteriota bacterium]